MTDDERCDEFVRLCNADPSLTNEKAREILRGLFREAGRDWRARECEFARPASASLDSSRQVLFEAARRFANGDSQTDLCDAAIEYAAFVQAHISIANHYKSVGAVPND